MKRIILHLQSKYDLVSIQGLALVSRRRLGKHEEWKKRNR